MSGLSISYIAALDRLIELEKLSDNPDRVELYKTRRELAKQGLKHLITDEGYFIKSLDPDGTRHGVYGAAKYGYFEAVCNHDAICFRIADDTQANKIYNKIASISGLRPYDWIITNYPSLDDMYVNPEKEGGYWKFGKWVNGGHWSTCEARMIMGYYRLGKFEDARRSMKRTLELAKNFRMDAPLGNFGACLEQPTQPINCVYDAWGVPAAVVRGLFEYIYKADGLRIIPHIPTGITMLEQKFPIRYGKKKIYLSVLGKGQVTSVYINGESSNEFDENSIFLPFDKIPDQVFIQICLGGARGILHHKKNPDDDIVLPQISGQDAFDLSELNMRIKYVFDLYKKLSSEGLGDTYEAAHAKLAIQCFAAAINRLRMQQNGDIPKLVEPSNQAANRSYIDTAIRLYDGLKKK